MVFYESVIHPLGYQTAAIAFLIAWAWCSGLIIARPRSSRLLSVSLFLGFLFYQATFAVFAFDTINIFGRPDIWILTAQFLGICWNFTTVLVALQWQDGRLDRRKVFPVTLIALLACATLATCSIIVFSRSQGQTYALQALAEDSLGRIYSSTYAGCMLFTKIMLIVVVLPQIKQIRSSELRIQMILVVVGTAMIATYSLLRLVFGLKYLFTGWLDTVEIITLICHSGGACVYVTGIALIGLARSVSVQVRGIRHFYSLLVLCQSGVKKFPNAGIAPTLKKRDFVSINAVHRKLLAVMVLLLDIEVLLSRTATHGEETPLDDQNHVVATKTRANYKAELRRLLVVARKYHELDKLDHTGNKNAKDREKNLRIAFFHASHGIKNYSAIRD